MVSIVWSWVLFRCTSWWPTWLWAVDVEESLIERLSPEQRSTILASLAIVLLLGSMLLTMVATGARLVRRWTRQPSKPSRMATDAWYEKPLVEHEWESWASKEHD